MKKIFILMSIGILIGCSDTSKDSVNQSKIASNSTYEKPEYDIGLSCKDSGTNPLVIEMILLDLDQKKIRFFQLKSHPKNALNTKGDIIVFDGIYDLIVDEEHYRWENIDNSKYKGEKVHDDGGLSESFMSWKHKQEDFWHWDLNRSTLKSYRSFEVQYNNVGNPYASKNKYQAPGIALAAALKRVTQCELSTVDDISSDIDNVYAAKKAKQDLKLKKKQDRIDSNKI